MKLYRFEDAEIARMRAEEGLADDRARLDHYHLCFALSAKPWKTGAKRRSRGSYYERGNGLKRSESRYRPEIIETNTAEQIKVCTRTFFERRTGWGAPDLDPIFIVGLPRSGSTLLEQILSSHSQVDGTQELPRHPGDGAGAPGPRSRFGSSAISGRLVGDEPRGLRSTG